MYKYDDEPLREPEVDPNLGILPDEETSCNIVKADALVGVLKSSYTNADGNIMPIVDGKHRETLVSLLMKKCKDISR